MIQNSGSIVTFGVSASVSEINWGNFYPSQTKSSNFTLTNTGSFSGKLTMNSTAPDFLSLSWDSEGAVLQPNETREVWVFLTASPSATQQLFNFDITITLEELEP